MIVRVNSQLCLERSRHPSIALLMLFIRDCHLVPEY